MEPKRAVVGEKFFIVIRGKSRKGFSRGCIGCAEAETARGELTGLMYGGGKDAGTPKPGGSVCKEDTYPLSRHQAGLLLFVATASKRLELLCNPQLFSAIGQLTPDDLVVVKHKGGHLPGLVKNLLRVGRNESKDDLLMLHMLGFQISFVDGDHNLSSKKAPPLPVFSAADIIQVVPSYAVPLPPNWRDRKDSHRKPVTRIPSLPTGGSRPVGDTFINQPSPSASPIPLEVGSTVEVVSTVGVTVYGVIRWMGTPVGKTVEWAGIELDYEVNGCSDGQHQGKRYFTCSGQRALFVPVTKCSHDGRFNGSEETLTLLETPSALPFDESGNEAPPIPECEAVSLLVGRMKGIQGHVNSCYLDATLFSLFSSSVTLNGIKTSSADPERPVTSTLRNIVNRLRRQGFVPAECVMEFRKQLGCETFRTEEKDPEEFFTVLFEKVLNIQPLLNLRSRGEPSQGSYTFQIFLQKEQLGGTPSVQHLMDTSCISGHLKFETMPSLLIVQMPRFGNKYKMFPHIIPSVELDLTDLLYDSPRDCFICGRLAVFECLHCLSDRRLNPGRVKQYCDTCNTQVHAHPSRRGHAPSALPVAAEGTNESPVQRRVMQLFAVLCIHTSHYVSFVKYGADSSSWLFCDSMADRCGDHQNGYNVPEVRACPEIGHFLSQPEEELHRAEPVQAPELVRRLLCDSYMFLYHAPATTNDQK